MPTKLLARLPMIAICLLLVLIIPTNGLSCGGTERWAVKVGTDPSAPEVRADNPISMTVQQLNSLPDQRDHVPRGNNTMRLESEKNVYLIKGHIVFYRHESDDGDYHIVITDDSLQFTPGGTGTSGQETGTSFIAEIPDPNCFQGAAGNSEAHSAFETQIKATRAKFLARFSEESQQSGIDVPVIVTGVAFYDRQHEQTGRAVNGLELHPLLDIVFDPALVGPNSR